MADCSPHAVFVDSLNQAWQQADWASLACMYHPDVVLVPPDLGANLIGWSAILQTYQDFAARATLHGFRVLNVEGHVFDHSQVVHSDFEADYSIGAARRVDTGTEIYVLETGERGQPVIVWRQQIIASAQSVEP